MDQSQGNPSERADASSSRTGLLNFLYILGIISIVVSLSQCSDDDEKLSAAKTVMSESACREVFDGMVKGHHWRMMDEDEKQCSGFINKWARALPETTYKTTGSALLVNGAAYSLAGARATRDAVRYADTKLETVVVRLPEGGVTLRFKSAEQADAALLAIGHAMGQARAGN